MADSHHYGSHSPTTWTSSPELGPGYMPHTASTGSHHSPFSSGYFRIASAPDVYPNMSYSSNQVEYGQPRIGQTPSSESFAANGPITHGSSFESSHGSHPSDPQMIRTIMPNVSPVLQSHLHPIAATATPMVRSQFPTYDYPFMNPPHHPQYFHPQSPRHLAQHGFPYFPPHTQPQPLQHSSPPPQPIWSSGGHHLPPPHPYADGGVVDFITELGPNDVLSGRGGATNSYKGNRAFRDAVKAHQSQYFQSSKASKPKVADLIVSLIREKGGRFLAKAKDRVHPQGLVVWYDIGAKAANEKTCQALRENAPELRKKMKHKKKKHRRTVRSESFSSLEEESKGSREDLSSHHRTKHVNLLVGPPSPCTVRRTKAEKAAVGAATHTFVELCGHWPDSNINEYALAAEDTHTTKHSNTHHHHHHRINNTSTDATNMLFDDHKRPLIAPWSRLMPNRSPVSPYSVDTLSLKSKELYRAFCPPEEIDYHDDNNSSNNNDNKDVHGEAAPWPILAA